MHNYEQKTFKQMKYLTVNKMRILPMPYPHDGTSTFFVSNGMDFLTAYKIYLTRCPEV